MLPIIDKTNPRIAYQTIAGVVVDPANNAIKDTPPIIDVLLTQFLELLSPFNKPKLARNNPIEDTTPRPMNIGKKNDPEPPKITKLAVQPDWSPINNVYTTYRYTKEPRKARIKLRTPFPLFLSADFAIHFTLIINR